MEVESLSPFLGDWGLLGAVLPIAAAICGVIWWLLSKDGHDVSASALSTKQAVTSMLMQTIIDEARQLMLLVEDHLPMALAQ